MQTILDIWGRFVIVNLTFGAGSAGVGAKLVNKALHLGHVREGFNSSVNGANYLFWSNQAVRFLP